MNTITFFVAGGLFVLNASAISNILKTVMAVLFVTGLMIMAMKK